MIDKVLDALSRTRWPLLLIGLAVMVIASGMFEPGEDESDARALMLGVGAILLGAGLVRLVYADRAQHDSGVSDGQQQIEGGEEDGA